MNSELVYVLYGSQTGNAKEIAKTIYSLLIDNKCCCKYLSLNETIQDETFLFLEKDKNNFSNLIIICSTTGNGDVPENANYFWRKLKNRNQPIHLFQNVRYAILGLGDSNYNKFAQMGKFLDNRFMELGGKRIMDLNCADDSYNFEESVDLFLKNIEDYFCNETKINDL